MIHLEKNIFKEGNYSVDHKRLHKKNLINLETAKLYLRVESNDDDIIIEKCIAAAEKYAEKNAGIILSPCKFYIDCSKKLKDFYLPFKPLLKICQIKNDEKILKRHDFKLERGHIIFNQEYSNIFIEAEGGYSEALDLPQDIEMALLIHIAHLYDNREGNTSYAPMMVQEIYSHYRILRI